VDNNILTATSTWPLGSNTPNITIFPGTVQFKDPLPSNCTFLSYNSSIPPIGPPAPVYPPGAIPIGPCGKGQITYYTGVQLGACGYGMIPDIYTIGAINTAAFNNSVTCGDCYLLTGPLGSTVVTITDVCTASGVPQWCSGGHTHFNLNLYTFSLISSDTLYSNVTYQRVSCPPVSNGKIQWTVLSGSTFYYLKLLVRYSKIEILKLEIIQGGTGWVPLVKESIGPYVCDNCFNGAAFAPPMSIRITGETGEVIIAVNALPNIPGIWPGDYGSSSDYPINGTVQFTDPCPSNCQGITQGNPTCFNGVPTTYAPTQPHPPVTAPKSQGTVITFSQWIVLLLICAFLG